MGKLYETFESQLGVNFAVTTYQPVDTRESVKEFNDLLDKRTFGYVYETMKVLVKEEDCVYLLVSKPDAAQDERGANIGRQFDTKNLDNNKKLWKRLTIETITEWSALKRAMDNLVNGALIYLANDIAELNASNQPTSTVHKAGLYFCENVNGTGKLTITGTKIVASEGELDSTSPNGSLAVVASENTSTLYIKESGVWKKFNVEIVDNLETNATDKALSAAQGKKLKDSIDTFQKEVHDLLYYAINGENPPVEDEEE